MRKIKMTKGDTSYLVISLLAIVLTIAYEVSMIKLRAFYRGTFQAPIMTYVLEIVAPLIVASLFYIKIMMQKSISCRFSLVVNVIALVLIAIGASLYDRHINILFFSIDYPKTAFVVCFQLCAIFYDLFSKRKTE